MRIPLTELVLKATVPVTFGRGLEVTVLKRGTKEEADVWSAGEGGVKVDQPLVTDKEGRPRSGGNFCFVDAGSYDLEVDGAVFPWEAPITTTDIEAIVAKAREELEIELRGSSIIDAREYVGITPTGAKDVASLLQDALDDAEAEAAEKGKGCRLLLPPWQSMIGATLELGDWVTLEAHGKASLLKLGAGVNASLLLSKRFDDGGVGGGTENAKLLHCYFDGNFAQNGATPSGTPVVGLDGIRTMVHDLEVRNGVVNFYTTMSRDWSPGTEKLEDGIFDLIGLKDPQEQNGVFEGPHDSHCYSILARSNDEGSANVVLAGTNMIAFNSHTYGNAKYAWQLESGELVNSLGEGGRQAQVAILGDGHSIRGGRYFSAGGADGKIGLKFGDGTHTANSTIVEGVRVEGCTNGAYDFTSASGSNSRITGWANGALGSARVGNPSASIVWDVKLTGGIGFGAGGSLNEFAAAEELELPTSSMVIGRHITVKVTGGAEIKKWKNPPPAQTEVTLIFTNVAKMVDGNNLVMAGNFEGGANRVITFVSDGTNMVEKGRSTN